MEPDSRGQLMINLHIDIDIFPGKSAREARRNFFWGYLREILGIFSGKIANSIWNGFLADNYAYRVAKISICNIYMEH